jgi:hypothetical protein
VYYDGFNLYYRAVRSTRYKWLDLLKLAQRLLPSHTINRIRYFTANAQALPADPNVVVRQQTYLRALRTIDNLSMHLGQFKRREKRGPLVTPIPGVPNLVDIHVFEEKGSDVNLATYLLADGYEGDYEQAVIVSNDSDLVLPIRLVRERLRLPVGVVNPNLHSNRGAPVELTAAATFTRRIREPAVRACQFPSTLTDANGPLSKPASW